MPSKCRLGCRIWRHPNPTPEPHTGLRRDFRAGHSRVSVTLSVGTAGSYVLLLRGNLTSLPSLLAVWPHLQAQTLEIEILGSTAGGHLSGGCGGATPRDDAGNPHVPLKVDHEFDHEFDHQFDHRDHCFPASAPFLPSDSPPKCTKSRIWAIWSLTYSCWKAYLQLRVRLRLKSHLEQLDSERV